MKEQQNILMITGDYPPMMKGVGDYAYHLSNALCKSGSSVNVITTKLENEPEYKEIENVHVRRIIYTWSFGQVRKIINIVRGLGKKTIINIQYYCPTTYKRNLMINFLPLILKIFAPSCPVIVTIHGFWEQSRLFRLRTIPMLRFANGIIYVDKQNRKLLSLYAGKQKPQKFIRINSNILPIRCDEQMELKWRSETNIKSTDIVVSFFGAIGEPKGFKYLLDAVQIVQKKIDKKIILLAIGGFHSYGENDPYQNKIKNLISKNDMESWVKIIQKPNATDCSKYLHISDLAVSPFLKGVSENSGSTLAYLIHEIPTIVTKGPPDSQNFFRNLGIPLCIPENTKDLAKGIEQVLLSKNVKNNIIKRLMVFKETISWNSIAKETSSFFNNILNKDFN